MRRADFLVLGLGTFFLSWAVIAAAQEKPGQAKTPAPAASIPLVKGKAALRQALQKTLTIHAQDEPLAEAMKSIGRELHVHIEIDKKALDDVGIAVDVPANLDATGLTARKALDLILRSLGLTFVIEDECIIVTTPEKAESRLEIVIYDVTDLVMHQDEKGQWYEKSGPLIDAIASCVGQTTWNSVGGPGAIAPLDLPHSASLAVSQTQNMHEEIAQFLADIRRVEAARRKDRAAAAPSDAQMVGRKIIKVAGDMTAAIAAANVLFEDPDRDALVHATNGFAWDLYRRLAHDAPGNVFFSPASIVAVLGMAQAGARDRTAAEFAQVLGLMREVDGQQRWTLAEARVQPAFASLMTTLRAKRLENGYDLLTANRLWGQTGARFVNAYLGLLAKTYQADVASIDFGNPVEAARQINEWANRQTAGFLHGNLDPRLLSMETRMALTNAVFFRGLWSDPFEPDATGPEDFRAGGKTFAVSMMTQLKSAEYAELDGVQLLQKGYLGKAVSMLIALPAEGAGSPAALEKRLSPALYQRWLAALEPREVEVHLPRFSFETLYQLKEPLRAMGLRTAFEPGEADFSGIEGGRGLYLQFVFHQARVEVDEEGTRAAAMTGAMGGGAMHEPPKPVVFRADHPFLFLIRDVRTGAILFLGRVERPTPAEPTVQPQSSPATPGHDRLRPRPAPKSGDNPFGS